jgi:hypothetical protein
VKGFQMLFLLLITCGACAMWSWQAQRASQVGFLKSYMEAKDASDSSIAFHLFGRAGPHGGGVVVSRISGCWWKSISTKHSLFGSQQVYTRSNCNPTTYGVNFFPSALVRVCMCVCVCVFSGKLSNHENQKKLKPEIFCCRCLDFLQEKHLQEDEGNFGFWRNDVRVK